MAASNPDSPASSIPEYTLLTPVMLAAPPDPGIQQYPLTTPQSSTAEASQLMSPMVTVHSENFQPQFSAHAIATNFLQQSTGASSSVPLTGYQQSLTCNGQAENSASILDPYASFHMMQRDSEDDLEDDERCLTANSSDESRSSSTDPFSPRCKIPLPHPYSPFEFWMEPSFIRRRNERERQRVRNVNEGFERLRNHLPLRQKEREKRLSKVETLRMTIKYIKYLQGLLNDDNETTEDIKENQKESSSSKYL